MAVKSIIAVDVDDAAFRSFQALFNKYQTQLAKMPGAWAAAGKEAKGLRTSFEAVAAALMAQAEQTRRLAKTQKEANEAARSQANHWRGMARSTASVAGNIARATKELLKWTALTSVFTGVVGAGGLYGIDRLALNVGAGRRSATGLGVNYGQQQAFGLNFGRVVDGDRFLGGVSEALRDVTKRVGLYGAGMTAGEMGGGTASTAVALLGHLKQLADRTPESMLGNVIQSRQLGAFVDVQDMMRLRGMSAEDFSRYKTQYGRDSQAFGLGGDTQRAWQDFAIQMSRAGGMIENVFVRGLTPLVPGLQRLSGAVADVVKAFLGSGTAKAWTNEAAAGLEAFAKYIGTPKFQNDVRDFANAIGTLAERTTAALRFLGVLPDPSAPPSSPVRIRVTDPLDWLFPKSSSPPQSLLDRLQQNSSSAAAPSQSSAVRVVPFYVRIDNNTGGNAVVSTSQVAQ